MDSARWHKLKTLFDSSIDLLPLDREAYLKEACKGDSTLEAEVAYLIAQHEEAGDFLCPLTTLFQGGEVLSNRYRILRQLGSGGMGEVYEAIDLKLGERIALKTVRADVTREKASFERLILELQLARKVTHPNVCRVFDIDTHGSEDPIHFFTMELLDGETLATRLKRDSAISPDEAIHIARCIAEGVSSAHALNIIHRDLKPSNIFLTSTGRVVITDFSIARHVEEHSNPLLANTTEIAGTPSYMAPELLQGQKATKASDTYALAVILHEMLTGKLPSGHPGIDLPSDSPKRWREIIARALHSDLLKRFQTPDELIRALDEGKSTVPRWTVRNLSIVIITLALFLSIFRLSGVMGRVSAFLQQSTNSSLLNSSTGQTSLLIGEIRNQTGESFYDFTASDLLRIALEQSPRIRVYPHERLPDVFKRMQKDPLLPLNEEIAHEICLRDSVAFFVVGSLASTKVGHQLNLRLVDGRSDQTRQVLTASFASKQELATSVEQIAVQLRRLLGEAASQIQQSKPLEIVTTKSVDALELYSRSREYAWRGENEKAADLILASLDLDPEFPMALVQLSLIQAGQRDKALETVSKAYAVRDRLPLREAYITAGTYHLLRFEYEEALDNFRKVTVIYPDDAFAHDYLSQTYELTGRYDLAVAYLRRLVAIEPDNFARRRSLAGDLANARQLDFAEQVFSTLPEHSALNWTRGTIAMAKGTPEELSKARSAFLALSAEEDRNLANPGRLYLTQILLLAGNLREAAVNLESDINTFEGQRINFDLARRLFLFETYVRLGELPRARRQADVLASAPVTPTRLYQLRLAAVLYARLQEKQKAKQLLAALGKMAEDQRGNFSRSVVYEVEGELSKSSGDKANALQFLQTAYTLNPDPLNTWALAQIRSETGSDAEALELYRNLISRKTEVLRYHPAFYWVESYLEAARSAQRMGRLEEATDLYAQFIKLWKESPDTGVELAQARAALEKLTLNRNE